MGDIFKKREIELNKEVTSTNFSIYSEGTEVIIRNNNEPTSVSAQKNYNRAIEMFYDYDTNETGLRLITPQGKINLLVFNATTGQGSSFVLPYDIFVNTISSATTGNVELLDHVLLNGANLTITDNLLPRNINCGLHIQNRNDACIYLDADTNWTAGADNPFILGTQRNNNQAFQMGMDNANRLTFVVGSGSNNTNIIRFSAGIYNQTTFSFNNLSTILDMNVLGISSQVPVNMNDQNITNVNSISTDTVNSNNNTFTNISVPISLNQIELIDNATPNVEDPNANGLIYKKSNDDGLFYQLASSGEERLLSWGMIEHTFQSTSNYTTSSTTYTDTHPTLTENLYGPGSYILRWAFEAGNTSATESCQYRVIYNINGGADVVIFEAETPLLRTGSALIGQSGFRKIAVDVSNNGDTYNFNIQMKASANTAIIQDITIQLYRYE